jgi:hypothetical protein
MVLASREVLFSSGEVMIMHLIIAVNSSGLPIIRAKLFHNMIVTISCKVGGGRGR